jgi:arylsulfatase A-like enzyme
VHYFDAHIPYLPPPPLDDLYDPGYAGAFTHPDQPYQEYFRSDDVDPRDVRHLVALYSGAVTHLDRCVGDLLRAGEARDALVLVTADHGEGLWEHERYFGHDTILYETALRVPLIVAGAGRRGIRPEPATTLDVARTLLRRCGQTPPPSMDGRDLLDDGAPPTARLFVETHPTRSKGSAVYGVRTDRAKVIWPDGDERWHAYDLAADPRELHDLGPEAGGAFAELASALRASLQARDLGDILTVDDEAGGMDEETREALQTLGYVE